MISIFIRISISSLYATIEKLTHFSCEGKHIFQVIIDKDIL
jgi:hypothetical protein